MHDTSDHLEGFDARLIEADAHNDARSIYQQVLDKIDRLFVASDWDSLQAHFIAPNRISTLQAMRALETIADVMSLVKASRRVFNDVGMTEHVRICRRARFSNDDKTGIEGEHTCYILRGSAHVVPPHRGFMRLILSEGRWRSAALHTEVNDTLLPTVNADRFRAGGTGH